VDDQTQAVGPWVDSQLPVTAQLMLRRVALEAQDLTADQLRCCLMATWRGWMCERHVVQEALLELEVDLQVEFPSGFSPLDVLDEEGAR